MTRSAAAIVDDHLQYPSSWDGRPGPLDMALLDHRRKEALTRFDQVRDRLDELKARVAAGRAKVAAARKAGGGGEKLVGAERKLAGLEADLLDLKLTVELPCHALTLAAEIARTLGELDPPQGSVLTVDLPGSVRVLVALDGQGDEVPF